MIFFIGFRSIGTNGTSTRSFCLNKGSALTNWTIIPRNKVYNICCWFNFLQTFLCRFFYSNCHMLRDRDASNTHTPAPICSWHATSIDSFGSASTRHDGSSDWKSVIWLGLNNFHTDFHIFYPLKAEFDLYKRV